MFPLRQAIQTLNTLQQEDKIRLVSIILLWNNRRVFDLGRGGASILGYELWLF